MQDWLVYSFQVLLSGGGIACGNSYANAYLKRDRMKLKLKNIEWIFLSNILSIYNRLALYTNWNISVYLDKTDIDYPLVMYYVCEFLQLRKRLIHSLGTLQFDNLDADTIINDFERRIVAIIKEG